MACVLEWTRADWGADHVFTNCSWTSGKKGTDVLASALRVDLKYHESSLLLTGSSGGFQVSSNSCTAFERTLMSSSWRPEGSELPSCSGSDPAQPSFSEAEMDMASSPSSWPKATNPSILEGGRKQSSGKEIGECGDRWVRRHGKTALPPPGEGGLTSGTLAAVSPTPNRPRTTSRRARSTRTGRSAQCPQSDIFSAASAWARPRQATQWRCWSSGSMGPAQILHTEAITNSRWSRRFWYNCREHRIYTVSSSSYLHALRQLASHLTGVSQ